MITLVPLEVACPECHEKVILEMSNDTEKSSSTEKAVGRALGPNVLAYTFDGFALCKCGRLVVATLTVSSHRVKD